MKTRTKEEVQKQVDGLKKTKERLQQNGGMFAEQYIEQIEMQIDILTGRESYADHEDDEPQMESCAYDTDQWLQGESDEDLFDND